MTRLLTYTNYREFRYKQMNFVNSMIRRNLGDFIRVNYVEIISGMTSVLIVRCWI